MSSVKTEGLDDYSPFTEGARQGHPAIMDSTDIDHREKYVTNESTSLVSGNKGVAHCRQSRTSSDSNVTVENNWPPFPRYCPCDPCLYHNIPGDIPSPMQDLVTGAYYLWIGYSITMIFNVLGTLSYFLSTGSMEAGSTFGMSIILVLLLPVLMFLGWYRPLYKAAKCDSSVSYFIYFLNSFILAVITCIQCVGINWLGACGWLNGTIVVVQYKSAGVLMLIIAALFTVVLAGQIVLLIQVHRKYRNIDPSSESSANESLKSQLKKSDSLREIATASMRNGTNYILEDIKDNK